MLNKMIEGFNKLIAYIKNSCKTSGSFMASFGAINITFGVFLTLVFISLTIQTNVFGVFAEEGHDYLADYASLTPYKVYDVSLAQDGSVKAYMYKTLSSGSAKADTVVLDGEGYMLPFNARFNTVAANASILLKETSGLNSESTLSASDATSPAQKTSNNDGFAYFESGQSYDYDGNFIAAPWMHPDYRGTLRKFQVNKGSNIKATRADYFFCQGSNYFNLSIIDFNGLDFSECTSMKYMFYGCSYLPFSDDIKYMNTSSCTDMTYMFAFCASFMNCTIDLSNWDTSNVVYINGMFHNCEQMTSLDVSTWDTGNVKNMSRLFTSCAKLVDVDLSKWDTGNVINMEFALQLQIQGPFDISNWDTHNVESMQRLFSSSKFTSLDLSKWDTSKVKNMAGIFNACKYLSELEISTWNTSSVENMSGAFNNFAGKKDFDLSQWDVSNVTDMSSMFKNASGIQTIDCSNWDTRNVTNASYFVNSCSGLKSVDFSDFDFSNCADCQSFFSDCDSLEVIDIKNWGIKNSTKIYSIFNSCDNLKVVDISGWDITNVTSYANMFKYDRKLSIVKTPRINNKTDIAFQNYMYDINDKAKTNAFSNMPTTNGVSLTLCTDPNKMLLYSDDNNNYYNDGTVTNLSGSSSSVTLKGKVNLNNDASCSAFGYAYSNGLVILDGTGTINGGLKDKCEDVDQTPTKVVASYEGYKPTGSLDNFFAYMYNLESFESARMDFSSVTSMNNLFDSSFDATKSAYLDFSHVDLSSCTSMEYMFIDIQAINVDISYWKLSTSSVDMCRLFDIYFGTSYIKEINMSNWTNGTSVSDFSYCFARLKALEKINFHNTDLGNASTNFSCFMYSDVHGTTNPIGVKQIILPKSVGNANIDLSHITTGLLPYDISDNKLSDTVVTTLIKENDSNNEYKLIGNKVLVSTFYDGENSYEYSNLGGIKMSGNYGSVVETYTCTVYPLNSIGNINAYYYSNGVLIFDGAGAIETHTGPFQYAIDHGSDITEIFVGDAGFMPMGSIDYLFAGFTNSNGIIFNADDQNHHAHNFYNFYLDDVTSMKYLCSGSTIKDFDLERFPSYNIDIDHIFDDATIKGTLNLKYFIFDRLTNAETMFDDTHVETTAAIVLPQTIGSYENLIDLPDLSSLDNKEWCGCYLSSGNMVAISNAFLYKLTNNTKTASSHTITHVKVTNGLTFSNLIEGTGFHDALKTLANNSGNNITAITVDHAVKSSDSQIATYLANGGIQVDDEGYTVMTMSGNTVTVYSSADVIYANEDCSNMFRCYVDDDTETVEDPKLQTITAINNLGQIDTSKTTDFEEMFSGLINLTSLNISSWDTSKVNDFSRMFKDCNNLLSLTLPSDFVSNKTDFIHTNYMFYGCKALPSIDISGWTGDKYTKIYGMFSGCSSATSITLNKYLISSYIDSALDSDIDSSERRGLESLFRGCTNVTSINLASANGVSEPFDFSNVTNLKGMFSGCEKLATLTLPTSNKILTTSVTNTSSMFEDCNSLTSINLSGCDMANVTKMYQMFDGCDSLSALTLPSHFITNKVTGTDSDEHEEGLYKLFYHCSNLTSLNLSGSDFSSINNYGYMFYHCDLLDETKVTLPANGFNSSPYVIENMFNKSGFTSIDLSNMNLSNLISNQNIINGNNIYDEDDNKVKEVILPSQVSSSYSATLSEPAGYAWFGFDASNNKLGTATYKAIPKTGAVTNLAKIKLEKEILYEEDDVEYYRTGTSDESITLAKYDSNTKDCAWDLSYNKDGSIMAYLYSNGLLILDGTGYINYENKPWITYGKENSITKIVGSVNKFKPTGNNGDTTSLENYFSLAASSNSNENKSLTCIDLTNMDFSKVIYISNLFANDTKLSSIIGIESLNVNNITHMNRLFDHCYNLQDLNLSAWNVSGVKYMEGMFRNVGLERTNGTALNLSGWTFSSSNRSDDRAHLAAMFCYAKLSTLNISNWKNFNNTSSFEQMFYYTNITDGVLDFGTVDCAKLGNNSLEGLIVNEIILPPAINSSSNVPLPATQSGKVWIGYDKFDNPVGSTTYTKLVARDGTNAGDLYKVKLTQDILFTIDGVNYRYADLKYTWDISKDMDGSTKAYFFDINGGTLIFDTIYDSSSNPSNRKLLTFDGFMGESLYLYGDDDPGLFYHYDTYDNDTNRIKNETEELTTSKIDYIIPKLNNENDYRDIYDVMAMNIHYNKMYFTPWSCLEACTDYEVKHVVCNKDIYSDTYNYFLFALDNLTGTLELDHFKLNSNYGQGNATLQFHSMVPYANGLTIKFNNYDVTSVYDYVFEYAFGYDYSCEPFNYKYNIDLRGNNLINMDSEFDSVMARLFANPKCIDKIYVPDSLTGFDNYELCYVLFNDSYFEEANAIMLEAYDSSDNFLGYTYHLVDSNNTYDNFRSNVSYLKPNLELSQYAAYLGYFDSSLSDDEKEIMLSNFVNRLFEAYEFTLPSYLDFFKDDTFKDNITGNDIINKTYFYNMLLDYYVSNQNELANDLFTNMFKYMNSKLNDNGGLDVTTRADLTDSTSNTNDFYLLNKYANEYLNNLLNSKINVNELSPYYYLDELTLNIKDYLGNAFNNLFSDAFNLVRINNIDPLNIKQFTDDKEVNLITLVDMGFAIVDILSDDYIAQDKNVVRETDSYYVIKNPLLTSAIPGTFIAYDYQDDLIIPFYYATNSGLVADNDNIYHYDPYDSSSIKTLFDNTSRTLTDSDVENNMKLDYAELSYEFGDDINATATGISYSPSNEFYIAIPKVAKYQELTNSTIFNDLLDVCGELVYKVLPSFMKGMDLSSYLNSLDTDTLTIDVNELDLSSSNVKVTTDAISDKNYTGSAITCDSDVHVYYENNKGNVIELVQGTDYTITGYSNNIDAGLATVTVTGDGVNVTGSRDITFKITRALDLSSVRLLDNALTSNPDLLDKEYDGNNTVISLNDLELTSSDNSSIPSNMKVIVNGTYDNSNAGSNKDVTLTYSYVDLSGNSIDTTYYTITDSNVTYKGNISKKKIDVSFNNLDNISKIYDKTSDIDISITCDSDDLVSGDTVSLPTQVHGNFSRVTASQSDSDLINITLDANWYNIDSINSNYELDASDAPSSISGLINKKEALYDLSHSSDSSNPYHYMMVFNNSTSYMLNVTFDYDSIIQDDNVYTAPGLYMNSKSSQIGTYNLHSTSGDELVIDDIELYGSDKDNYFIKQPKDRDKFNDLYLEICNKLIDDNGYGTINITAPTNGTYTGNVIDVKSQISIRDSSNSPAYNLIYDTDYTIEYYKDGVLVSDIKDAGSYQIKVIGKNNYSGSKTLNYYVQRKVIHKADIDLAEKDIVKVKDGTDVYPTTFTNSELHLSYTNNLTSPSEVVPINFTDAYFVRDDDEFLYEALENTATTLRNIKFEGLSIDGAYTNNYEFDYDVTSLSNRIVINNANYLIDDTDPTILDITTEEKTYGRGMPIKFNVTFSEELDGTLLDGLKNDITKLKLIYKIGDNRTYDLPLTNIYNPDVSILSDRRTVLEFSGVIDPNLDLGLPKAQCGEYTVGIDSIYVNDPTKVCDRAGNYANLNSINNILVRNIKPFDINKVKVDTRGFSIDLTHTDTSRTSADTFLSEYHLEIPDDLYFDEDIFDTDDKKEKELLSKLKFTVTRMKDADSYDDNNPSDSFYTKTYSFSDLYDDGILEYTQNSLLEDYDISIKINYLEFYDFDDSDDELHLGIFRKNDIYGCELKLEIDEDALTNDTGNTNIEAKASHVAIFNAPEFALDDDNDEFNPNKYFTFVYTDALGDTKNILLTPNGDSSNGYKFINALTNEEVYFYQDDKISILNQIGTDVNSLINEFHFDIVSDLKGLVLDTPVMNIFGMDYALNIDYVFSDVTNFLRDNVINNIDKSVYDIIKDLYLHYDAEEGPDEFYHFIARNNGLKNIILRVRTIDDITRDVIKVINDNSKTDSEKDLLYKFISPTQKDFSIIDPNNDISNYTDSDTPIGTLTYILENIIDDSGNSFIEGTFAKELDRRNTIKAINKNNLKDTLLDIARDLWKGFLNCQDLINLLDQDPISDSDIEKAMIAYQKMPSWVVSAYLDNDVNVIPPSKTFGYYIDKLFKLYYGESDDLGNIVTPGVIDGYGSKVSSSDNENFEVFGLINKVDKPNIDDKVFLDVRKITEKDELDSVRSELNSYYVSQSLSFDDKVLTPYDIKLYVKNLSSGNKNYVQPKSGESILVKLELDPLFYYTDFKIYHTTHKDDGSVDEIDSLPLRKDLDLTNNKYYVYFEADSFSTFTITCDAKTIVVSEDGDIDSEGKYLGGSITPNGLIPILEPNVTKTKLFTITLNNDYKAEIYKDFSDSPFMTVNSNKMITLDNLDSDSDNIYLLVKYIYDPKVDPDPVDPEPLPDKPKDLSSATITIQVLSNKKFIDGYKDNTFRPNEYMTRAEFAKVISLLSSNFIYSDRDKDSKVATNTYSDIKDTDWYKEYVGYLTDRNILRGYSANNGTKNIYKGNSYIKRSEVSKILTSMFDIKSNDISIINYANEIKGRWYENSVSKLIKAGYLRGYSDGTIKAENYMTRAEVVALINRVVKNDYANINPAQVKGYKDISKGSWYYNDIIAASN